MLLLRDQSPTSYLNCSRPSNPVTIETNQEQVGYINGRATNRGHDERDFR